MQTVVCEVQNCGYRSKHGFCLNKLTVISKDGVCKHLKSKNWWAPVDQKDKNTYKEPKNNQGQGSIGVKAIEERRG